MSLKYPLGPGNYDPDALSQATGLACPAEESKTQQSFKDECDINTIVQRFGLTGEMPGDLRMPMSGDFTGINDFHQAMNVVRQAEEEFARLPANVRARFHNDPGELLDFVDDDNNRAEAEKLGLVSKPAEVSREGTQLPTPLTPPAA